MKFTLSLLLILMVSTLTAVAQVRPLLTESPETVEKEKVLLEVGFEFLQNVVFQLSGLEGDLTRVGVTGLRLGAGEKVEMQLFWTAQDFLNINGRFDAPNSGSLDFSGNSTSDIGNLFIGAKMKIASEKERRPGLGIRFSVELPNTSSESGLGTDETNFFSSFLIEKHLKKLRASGEIGLAILGDPVSPGSLDDLLIYGLALLYPVSDSVNLLMDFHGLTGSGGIGTEERTLLRIGTQIKSAGLYWDAAAVFGFQETDPDTGLIFGISKEFKMPSFD